MRKLLLSLFPLIGFSLSLKIPAFPNGGTIPIRYTCDGENINPKILIGDIPKKTLSLVLIMHDPDAPGGDFTHWVVYSIPPTVRELPVGIPRIPIWNGIKQGINDFGFIGYGGPCPPPWDKAHRYIFELYALDYVPNIPPGAKRKDIEKTLKGHILEKATYVGSYKRNIPFKFSLH
jgi:Raf kinase inhibitor-like YbhB/YbcL family protein